MKFSQKLFIALAITILFIHSLARAESFENICGAGAINQSIDDQIANVQNGTPDAKPSRTPESEQKQRYCDAARMYKSGSSKNKSLAGIWGAVGAVCAVSCFSRYVPPSACEMTAGAAALDEIMQTKNLGGLFGALTAGGGMGMMVGGAALMKGDAIFKKDMSKGKKEACMVMAYGFLQSMAKSEQAGKDNQAYQQNLDQAAQFTTGRNDESAKGNPTSTTPFKARVDPTNINLRRSNESVLTQVEPSDCESGANGNATSAIKCAAVADTKLPEAVKNNPGAFANAFNKVSGQDLGQFVKNGDMSAQSLTGAAGGSGALPADTVNHIGAFAKAADADKGQVQTTSVADNTGTYSGGRGGASGGGEAATDPLGDAFKSTLDNMFGKKVAEQSLTPGELAYKQGLRANGPMAMSMDASGSVFDRVGYRYRELTPEMLGINRPTGASVYNPTAPRAPANAR